MRARIAVLDWTQTLLGPAVALKLLGAEVRYYCPDPARLPDFVRVLVEQYLGGGDREPCLDADRVIYAEGFSDAWWALQAGSQLDAPVHREAPLASTIHPLQLDLRLDALAPSLQRCNDLVVVDMSDLAAPLHPGFLSLPGTKLKRELRPEDRSAGIGPFPFLYNPVLLALERFYGLSSIRPRDFLVPWDGWFSGTIGHARYGGARRQALDTIVARHPGKRFAIHEGGVPTLENLRETQRAKAVLHPPGRGTICFRTHEALFFGKPMLVADAPGIVIDARLRAAFCTRLEDALPEAEVRGVYAESYCAEVAARQLQDAAPVPT